MIVFSGLLLLTSGLLIGRMWQWRREQVKSKTNRCPRCAIADSERRTAQEISAIRRRGEEQMRRTTSQARRPRHDGADESVWRPGQR